MAVYKRKSTRQILEQAKRAQENAERWLNTTGKKIQADYDRVNAQFNAQMHNLDKVNALISRSFSADVSDDELNAVMAEIEQSSVNDLKKSLPSVPTHDPSARKMQSKHIAPVKQNQPTKQKTSAAEPVNGDVQKQQAIATHFNTHIQAIADAKTMKAGLKAILSAVKSVDQVHGTNSAGTYGKKLAARVQEIDKKMMPELKRRLAHQKKYPALSKNSGNDQRITDIKNRIQDLKTDMKAYAERVQQHCKTQASQAMEKAATISSENNQNHAPRGPGAR